MRVKGWGGSEIDWNGETLTITATSGAGRVALFGQDGANGQDSVSLDRSDITDVTYKPGKPVVTNGLLAVTAGEQTYKVHFLRKHREQYEQIAQELQRQ